MALTAGTLAFTLHFGKDLKDSDWFGRQDPYATIKVGGQTFRSRTHNGGGRNPVWSETFTFNVINENNVEISVFDEDTVRDDLLGVAVVPLAKTREQGSDRMEVPVVSKKGKQHGIIMVSMTFTTNDAIRQSQQPQMQPVMQQPQMVMQQPQMVMQQQYGAPMAYGMTPVYMRG